MIMCIFSIPISAQDTTATREHLEIKTLLGYPTGVGANFYIHQGEQIKSGLEVHYAVSFFEGLVKQFDLGWIVERRRISKKGWNFSYSAGWQYWSGSDGVWHALRLEAGWNKPFSKNKNITYGFSVVPLLFLHPKVFPEGNVYFQLKYKLF
jgi:hypothetical protein